MYSSLIATLIFLADGVPAADGGSALLMNLMPFAAIGLLFYFLLIRPQRREQSRRQAMLAGVKKNDRVVTSSGIFGVVTNVHREAGEVTVKVDETSNTKLRMTLGSIAQILGDESAGCRRFGIVAGFPCVSPPRRPPRIKHTE